MLINQSSYFAPILTLPDPNFESVDRMMANLIIFISLLSVSIISDIIKIKPKILNGFPSEQGQFPYYCIPYDANQIAVHLGLLNVYNKADTDVNVLIATKDNFHTHPNYMQSISLDDIGLMVGIGFTAQLSFFERKNNAQKEKIFSIK